MDKKYIDAEALKKDLLRRGFYPAIVKTAIERAPAADVAEVVRCKDCKYAYINSFSAASGVVLCKKLSNEVETAIRQQDDFCSYGERREE